MQRRATPEDAGARLDAFLAIFRRFIPAIGPLDLSPLVAILLLNIVGSLVANLIAG